MKYFFFLFLLIGLSACAPDDSTESNNIAFEDFQYKFLNDDQYQMRHIQFPLKGVPAMATEELPDFRWEQADWQLHRPITNASGFRSSVEYISDGFVIEIVTHQNGKYAMERRFAKLSGNEWMLIYYAAINPIK